MNTPIVDFLNEYANSDFSRFHMPGHKGCDLLGFEHMDITEIKGADELYAPEGIIRESEENATDLFGTAMTFYSTEGSSHTIRSMIFLAKQLYCKGARGSILAARNAHKAFLYSLALADLDAEWIYPSDLDKNSSAGLMLTPKILKDRLTELRDRGELPFAVFITSPDYLGEIADVRELSDVCHSFSLPLLVDNAHGAYLHFMKEKKHPMDLGADICCDSAHKTLPVVTGGAYLHFRENIASPEQVKAVMEFTGTTSPSYLIMASLDCCNRALSEDYPGKLSEAADKVNNLKKKMREAGIPYTDSEDLKIVIHASEMGVRGYELGEILRTYHAEPEFTDADYVVLMVTPYNRDVDFERVYEALLHVKSLGKAPLDLAPLKLRPLVQRMSVRQALFSMHEFVETEDALGRILGAPTVSCPPAIPIAISGEVIEEDTIRILKSYGVDRISVVKN